MLEAKSSSEGPLRTPSSTASLLAGVVFGFAGRHLGDAASGAPEAARELARANLEVVVRSRSLIIMSKGHCMRRGTTQRRPTSSRRKRSSPLPPPTRPLTSSGFPAPTTINFPSSSPTRMWLHSLVTDTLLTATLRASGATRASRLSNKEGVLESAPPALKAFNTLL